MKNFYCLVFWKWKTSNGFLILWCTGNLESGGKGEKNPKNSTTIALQSPFPEYNGRFEIGLGQSMVIYVYPFIFSKFLLKLLQFKSFLGISSMLICQLISLQKEKKLTSFLSSWPLPIILVLTSAMACLGLMEWDRWYGLFVLRKQSSILLHYKYLHELRSS